MQKDNIQRPSKGLHLDSSLQDSPKDTYRFALNSVIETELGDFAFLGNEESNTPCANFPIGYTPIGKEYMGEGKTIIFLVNSDETASEIGIYDDTCKYETHVNDTNSETKDKLGFKISKQIDATYRLRRGYERTVYFTDNYNKPRYYNFDKPQNFLEGGLWISKKFDLFRTINLLPELLETKILENSGSLLAGSYSILLQYLDEDYNGTKFLELISNINIINDSLRNNYVDIEGSTNIAVDVIKSPPTNKAIQIKLGNLDKTYTYFRLAIVEYNNGSGQISDVKYTSAISTKTNIVLYTGTNSNKNGTIEEVELTSIDSGIYRVGSLEQIDNKLILANISGPQYNYCNLQKYASKIKADVIVKDILLTSVHEDHNTKNPLVHYNGLSHQPGDIYSYGIVYIFDDLTESPAFHIPGKNNSLSDNMTFIVGQANVKGMRSSNNKNLSESYINTNSCGINDYWGKDSEGQDLTGTNVRHHRFPTRDEINIGFVEEISGSTNTTYKKLALNLEGIIKKSVLCDPITDTTCAEYYKAPIFTLTVKYKLNGIDKEFVSPNITEFNTPTFVYSNIFLDTDVVTDIELWYKESDGSAIQIVLTAGSSSLQSNNLIYKISEISSEEETGIIKYKVPILGIKFSGIDIPSEADSNGKIIGYKIVRQERKDADKNIMDSAILLPMLTNNIGQGNFISSSMIAPLLDNGSYPYDAVSKNTVQILSPSHKFTDKNMEGYTSIEEIGKFNLITNNVTGHLVQDVYPGSSADSVEKVSDNTKDNDGFSLKQMVRMSRVKYNKSTTNKVVIDNIDTDLFNLQPLKTATHSDGESTITNLSCDNKSLILSKKSTTVDYNRYKSSEQYYPYVYIKKDNTTFYSNYRSDVYYQTDHKVHIDNTCELYSGDIHISPLKYSNHIYGNTIVGRRISDFNWGGLIAAILITIFAIVIAIVTFGAAAPASVAAISLAVGAIITSVGAIAMFVSGVIDAQDFANLYQEKWLKGLDFTLFDIIYQRLFYEPDVNKPREQLWFRDDTIKWYGETIQDFWFESSLNISLRVPYNNNSTPNYLKPLTNISSNRPDKIQFLSEVTLNNEVDNVDDYYHYRDDSLNWECYEENYFGNKILEWKNNKWNYKGISEPILYMLNNDHNINKNIIKYYALPQEYDCCSDDKEKFPHRWHWSEQSFQEELTDNYRMFLPNNYKDLEGETGEITNVFKISNNLFMHTKEALWQIPRNYQERVTDQIISFIGTGSYGEIPAQKILDGDTGASAGTQHKWSSIKTPNGYFFMTENQRNFYSFDGAKLSPISSEGLYNWFFNNTPVKADEQYYRANYKTYPFKDNPSNPIGTGFITSYDPQKERILLTKKDFILSDLGNEYELCTNGNSTIIFPNINDTISYYNTLGWDYKGIDSCKLKFEKTIIKTKIEIRNIIVELPNNADIIVWLDTSGSFTADARQVIKDAINSWLVGFNSTNSNWNGNLYYLELTDESESERWLHSLEVAKADIYNGNINGKNIVMVSFVNEAVNTDIGDYHTSTFDGNIDPPTGAYMDDYEDFIDIYNNDIIANGGSFYGLSYPIVFTGQANTQEFLKHVLAAINGIPFTSSQVDNLLPNPAVGDWDLMKSALQTVNEYPDNGIGGLNQYGWEAITNRYWGGSGQVITAEQFQQDMNAFIQGNTTIEEVEVIVTYLETEYLYVDGEILDNLIQANTSWTLSYSLKQNSWTSWHSYLPNFYINTPSKIFSWIPTPNNSIWRHNTKDNYQTYYGIYKPHIIEYVSLSTPLVTRIWNHLKLLTEAKKLNIETQEYYALRYVTFNKAILYNSRQCSGLLDLIVKDTTVDQQNYLMEQVINPNNNSIIIDRTEIDWLINDFRDMRIDYTKPIWDSDIHSLQNEYFMDKILNSSTIDINKDWTQLESFRDKYLVVRLIFNTFADVKLITNYSVENEQQSLY